jgi:hypothetical protein
MWYARDKQTAAEAAQAAREEIEKVKQEEEEAMRVQWAGTYISAS